jgi:hypothetical protein
MAAPDGAVAAGDAIAIAGCNSDPTWRGEYMIKRVVLLLAMGAALVACNPTATPSPSISIPTASPSMELPSASSEASPSSGMESASPSSELMSPSPSPS